MLAEGAAAFFTKTMRSGEHARVAWRDTINMTLRSVPDIDDARAMA